MTAKIASKYFSYTDHPSGYCLFDTFCPNDKTDEILETAMEWKACADTLPEEFQPQVQRIWKLWTDNRNALEPLYRKLPSSVFQADLNSTNILLDESENFIGVYDFNLCGKEVFLNYLFRETCCDNLEDELNRIFARLKLVSGYYTFSEHEKQAALMLYRCVKPLFYRADDLKKIKNDNKAVAEFLDETEFYLTKDIDFKACMNVRSNKLSEV